MLKRLWDGFIKFLDFVCESTQQEALSCSACPGIQEREKNRQLLNTYPFLEDKPQLVESILQTCGLFLGIITRKEEALVSAGKIKHPLFYGAILYSRNLSWYVYRQKDESFQKASVRLQQLNQEHTLVVLTSKWCEVSLAELDPKPRIQSTVSA